MTIVIVLVIAGATLGVSLLTLAVRAWRQPAPLRGDWWTEFEREFRAYAERAAESRRGARHAPTPRRPARRMDERRDDRGHRV